MNDATAAAPACNLRDRASPVFDLDSLELVKCHSFEVNTALNDFEIKPGLSHRMETWPHDVRARLQKVLDEWIAKHPAFKIRLVSTGLHQGVAVVVLHYVLK